MASAPFTPPETGPEEDLPRQFSNRDQLAAVLRPACRQLESQYRDTDGLVLELAPAL